MIFAGGYNLKKSNFINNFLYISLYGVLGTIVTFGIVLGLTLAINNKSTLSLSEAFSLSLIVQYSATICATDSVAALTMIKSDKYPKLFSIIFGEGMVNDAVAIILFRVVGPIFDVHPDTE
jgi:sodium/hydrogen exchanger-like protein 6/7/sodium/hydrogen exchanger 8